jgi:predicted ATPase
MPSISPSLSLTITNPLVLYRTLLATKKIDPDSAQHRLALHLQKVYTRLRSYSPEVDYEYRLEQINRAVGKPSDQLDTPVDRPDGKLNGVFSSLRKPKEERNTLAITRRLTSHESAINIQSPQGLLLYGDVGTGKSMLIDLLANCLPNQKKRRWHFNNFMLEIFARLEQLRKKRLHASPTRNDDRVNSEEHSLLCIARDLITTSPILFLDEFQLPDRAASRILTNLLTPFFHLGGVLIATSNRMPEELAKASGIEFTAPPSSRLGLFKHRWGLLGGGSLIARNESMSSGKRDFALFLDVLRARCEIWNMEGSKDWRRQERENITSLAATMKIGDVSANDGARYEGEESKALENGGVDYAGAQHMSLANENESQETKSSQDSLPSYYFVRNSSLDIADAIDDSDPAWTAVVHAAVSSIPPSADQIPWQSSSLRIYGRILLIPRHLNGVAYWTFSELCCANLGPADFISIAATFHTVILTDVPVLTLLHKNEARRLITLLDALYEARCKLLIRAAAGPDTIFFPEEKHPPPNDDQDPMTEAIYAETLAEIYQDQTSPFRPNTASTYTPSESTPSYPALSPSSTPRSILADEDSDFGPVHKPHTLSGPIRPNREQPTSSDGPRGAGNEIGKPDFSRTMAFTGEDERFAYKRARSRLWEMCSARWWARKGEPEEWWRPLSKESRHWEGDHATEEEESAATDAVTQNRQQHQEDLFRYGASPFRVHGKPPPKFGWAHAWGMMRWGKAAGTWGKGVDGLNERRGEREGKAEGER